MRIAFVGASGYGNIGDDTYPLVFADLFSGHELFFLNSDIPRVLPSAIDLLVMGGGGILHNVGGHSEADESPHFHRMRYYMDWAQGHQIRWGFLSCGFQFRPDGEPFFREALRLWAPYLRKAHFAVLRSSRCVRIAQALSAREDIQFLPDAAYLYAPALEAPGASGDVFTIVPAGVVNPRNGFTQHLVRLFRSMDYRIVWLSMGARIDDAADLEYARRLYPATEFEIPSSPLSAFRRIAQSRMVFSGRYHGMVFARRSRIPFIVPESAPYKLIHEPYEAHIPPTEQYRGIVKELTGLTLAASSRV